MRREFFLISAVIFAAVGLTSWFWPPVLWSLIVLAPVFLIGMNDALQTRQAIRRNFPLIGNVRYLFEMIRPELQQYFVESNQSGRPIPRDIRSVIYQRAKGALETQPFGTQLDVHSEHYEWVNHTITPKPVSTKDVRILVGGPDCRQPYLASVMNISAMSYGALSSAAVSALNLGAQKGHFYHNTGEGGMSPYHLLGGDLCWQIGTGYFGCRTPDGRFNEEAFRERAILPNCKMIEIKLSQGAKPGKGGILPAQKVSEEVAKIRLVPQGKDVMSPAAHAAFSTPKELLSFVKRLRDLSDGKPVGFKLCVGNKHEFIAICKAMIETGIKPDFITVDGGEGGTGAAPLEFTNYVGAPLEDGLSFVVDALRGFGLKQDIRVIGSGKVFTSFDILKRLAMGADMVSSARGMMLAMGCIQALKCNSNECPTGVATSNPQLVKGLHIPHKKDRVARYHHETVHAFVELLAALGYHHPSELQRADVNRRLTDGRVRTYEELHPSMPEGYILDHANWSKLAPSWQLALHKAQSSSFQPAALREMPTAPSRAV
ncbi:MAG: FMN-binding glutamate synthase family protein [Bdellovibrionales bacterium]|nr:FMN-binding glutamate synthase family protein [Bdellovibrionales bacterium]